MQKHSRDIPSAADEEIPSFTTSDHQQPEPVLTTTSRNTSTYGKCHGCWKSFGCLCIAIPVAVGIRFLVYNSTHRSTPTSPPTTSVFRGVPSALNFSSPLFSSPPTPPFSFPQPTPTTSLFQPTRPVSTFPPIPTFSLFQPIPTPAPSCTDGATNCFFFRALDVISSPVSENTLPKNIRAPIAAPVSAPSWRGVVMKVESFNDPPSMTHVMIPEAPNDNDVIDDLIHNVILETKP